MGASCSEIFSKLCKQVFVSEFDSHWVPHSSDLVVNKLCKSLKVFQIERDTELISYFK